MDEDPAERTLSLEEIIEQMKRDELEDDLREQTLAAPIEFARTRGIVPQKIYYLIRMGKLRKRKCDCGRSVVNIQEADELLKELQENKKEIQIKDEEE